MIHEGFIINAIQDNKSSGVRLYYVGRLNDGRTFAVIVTGQKESFFIRYSDKENAARLKGRAVFSETDFHTMDGESCMKINFDTKILKDKTADLFHKNGIRTYEADLRFADLYRLNKCIHGAVRINGEPEKGNHVDLVFIDPELKPGNRHPELTVLSFDIETNTEDNSVLAIGIVCNNPFTKTVFKKVLFLGDIKAPVDIICFKNEKELLLEFVRIVKELDPDIITGWNIIDFDFFIINSRLKKYNIPFKAGRSDEDAVFLNRSSGMSNSILIPGRQVWDGVRIVRASPEKYPEYTLETVSQSILGEGKDIEIESDETKLDAIKRMYKTSPLDFCKYCLRDAELVIEIFKKTGLLELTLKRCELIGVAPDRAWTSILAFEHLYIEHLHKKHIAAPTAGIDSLPVTGALGGYILEPYPGLHHDVMVFDFKSLYPSIIRTFNIEPLSYTGTGSGLSSEEKADLIKSPADVYFKREPGILPGMLSTFFAEREKAKRIGDKTASYVYKIIMNSFYGVLGADGCRFAGSDIAGSITGFGQELLKWCKALFEEKGYNVIYGDTDSLFVERGANEKTAEEICGFINRSLDAYVKNEYKVESFLELEYEKTYSSFFLPPVRGESVSGRKGRAKGYAGLTTENSFKEKDIVERIEIKGMEAVRRDWTDLSHDFQKNLLALLFKSSPQEEIVSYIQELLKELHNGKLDNKLVYRKALRKPLSHYTKNRPPHVKAAEMLPKEKQRGVIRYIITKNGPQPENRVASQIDYKHYVDKQLKPILWTFTETGVISVPVEELFDPDKQLFLF
jgi:DNA polymerase II